MSQLLGDDTELQQLAGEAGSELLQNLLASYEATPQEKLKQHLGKIASSHPLVIIIDNLDRCDADFTLEFLSKIKDVFDIKNLLFVIAYDKHKVAEFIKKKFGNDNSTTGFLRKYVAAEFYLPNFEEHIDGVIDHFYEKNAISSKVIKLLKYDKESEESEERVVKEASVGLLKELYARTPLTLRMVEQIVKRTSVVLDDRNEEVFGVNEYAPVCRLIVMLAMKLICEEEYYALFYGGPSQGTSQKSTEDVSKVLHKNFKHYFMTEENKPIDNEDKVKEQMKKIQKEIEVLCVNNSDNSG